MKNKLFASYLNLILIAIRRRIYVLAVRVPWYARYYDSKVYKAVKESSLFDSHWYSERYLRHAHAQADPILHYIKFGVHQGYDPSPTFRTSYYLAKYKDVREYGINPLYHYIIAGQREGRRITYKDIKNNRNIRDSPATDDKESRTNVNIAICLHCFYDDVAQKILDRLERITSPYSLFVSYPHALSSNLERRLKEFSKEIYLIPTTNSGRDVKPFLECMQHPAMSKFDLVLKIHTKRGKTLVGDFWRHVMLDAVIGSQKNFDGIVETFVANPNIMLAGPKYTYISANKFMYGNKDNIEFITKKFLNGFFPKEWGFFAGTIFWARPQLFRPLLNCDAWEKLFLGETGAVDGQMEHAFERLFGLLPLYLDGEILLLENIGYAENEQTTLRGCGKPLTIPPTQIMTGLLATDIFKGHSQAID